jgi:hypothetical protein
MPLLPPLRLRPRAVEAVVVVVGVLPLQLARALLHQLRLLPQPLPPQTPRVAVEAVAVADRASNRPAATLTMTPPLAVALREWAE